MEGGRQVRESIVDKVSGMVVVYRRNINVGQLSCIFVDGLKHVSFFSANGYYLRVKFFTRLLPAGEDHCLYPHPWVKFLTRTLTRRVGYPRISVSAVKLPSLSVLDAESALCCFSPLVLKLCFWGWLV
jgi:hypothetical protein